MAANKKTKLLAKQLFKLSVVNGVVSPEQVTGVLGYIEKHEPAHTLALLRIYHRAIATELAKSRAVVEHAGPVNDATLKAIEAVMTRKYGHSVVASAKSNPSLLAGLRVRVGSDVYESSVSGQLSSLSV